MKNTKKDHDDIVNLEIQLENVEIDVEVDDSVYSEDDYDKICEIVECMSKNIWIDRSYVDYNRNPFNDAFILEDGWNELMGLVKKSLKLKKNNKKLDLKISSCIAAIILAYIYSILDKYEYDCSSISLVIPKGNKMIVSYYKDNRTKWEN